MVRLQAKCAQKRARAIFTFNPTMVRLQAKVKVVPYGLCNFLSIPLWCDCKFDATIWDEGRVPALFQSHYGAIARLPHLISIELDQNLSIPLWCDCKRFSATPTRQSEGLSIPLWCDCKSFNVEKAHKMMELSIPLWCDCKGQVGKTNLRI